MPMVNALRVAGSAGVMLCADAASILQSITLFYTVKIEVQQILPLAHEFERSEK